MVVRIVAEMMGYSHTCGSGDGITCTMCPKERKVKRVSVEALRREADELSERPDVRRYLAVLQILRYVDKRRGRHE